MQTMNEHKFNPAIIRPGAGFCYIVAFSDGVLKAGRTNDLFSRYESHRIDAKNRGISIDAIAFTGQHEGYKDTEALILERLSDACESRIRKEYFIGISFDDAAKELHRYSGKITIASTIVKDGKDGRFEMVSLRVSDDEFESLKAAAASERMKLGTWIKRAALIEADRVKSPQLPAIQPQPATTTPPHSQ